MKENEKPPVKPRKLKKMDEYEKVILRAWKAYQEEIERKVHPARAEREATKSIYPNDPAWYTTLKTWKKYGLWPHVVENPTDKRHGALSEKESRNQKEWINTDTWWGWEKTQKT
ncbi:MAG: hypothetical protein ACLP5H_33115 [Desulfomonilaceae bacterium]